MIFPSPVARRRLEIGPEHELSTEAADRVVQLRVIDRALPQLASPRLPASDAARVSIWLYDDRVEPTTRAAEALIPYRTIDRALEIAVGPYVPAVDRTLPEGAPLADPAWATTALMAIVGLDTGWTIVEDPVTGATFACTIRDGC